MGASFVFRSDREILSRSAECILAGPLSSQPLGAHCKYHSWALALERMPRPSMRGTLRGLTVRASMLIPPLTSKNH